MNDVARIERLFSEHFFGRNDYILVRSPGRVNLIGEHTDYNEGFVLPAAIDRKVIFAVAPRTDTRCRFFAADLNESFECDLSQLERSQVGWPTYLIGIVDQLQRGGMKLLGCDVAFGGNLPIDAGLASSAAVEVGFAYALNELFELNLDRLELVRLSQRAENEFVGVRCGIMDQFANVFGEDRRALMIDCRTLTFEYIPFERTDVRVVLCETPTRRVLAASEYNVRRQQCEAAVSSLRQFDNRIRNLRDVTLDFLRDHKSQTEQIPYKRAEYVIRENERVLAACDHLRKGDFSAFGHRMYESHEGLSKEYQVSNAELDQLVEIAAGVPGVLGARMMGAGFGGCTINLVEEQHVQKFEECVCDKYRASFGHDISIYTTKIERGTSRIKERDVIHNYI